MLIAAKEGDREAFGALAGRYERELLAHCYRMLGSLQDAEDALQETLLRAWRHLSGFEGRSTLRAWLYRIATNRCLDMIDRRKRRVLPHDVFAPSEPSSRLPMREDIPWLQPFPTPNIEPTAPSEDEPEAVVARRETIELTFIAAIQHLPPKPRAVLLLRDVVGWPAKDTAAALDLSVAAANSALHRARARLREALPDRPSEWTPAYGPTDAELATVRRYMDAVDRSDIGALAELLATDIRTTMPPWPTWFQGSDHVLQALRTSWNSNAPEYVGRLRTVFTGANGQPAVAAYSVTEDSLAGSPFAISVLTITGGLIHEIVAFHDPALFTSFDLPAAFPEDI